MNREQIHYNDLRNKLKTGDVVFVSGWSSFSKIIKEVTGQPYSHLAMCVWGVHLPAEFGAEPDRLYVWESTGRGVGEVDFVKANRPTHKINYLTRLFNYRAGEVAIRRLVTSYVSDDAYNAGLVGLKAHCLANKDKAYETNKLEMLKAVPWVKAFGFSNDEQTLETMFCWEAVAAAYQAMNLLPLTLPASYYSINDWQGEMPLLNDAVLEDKLHILEF